jgi:hypothetical protein
LKIENYIFDFQGYFTHNNEGDEIYVQQKLGDRRARKIILSG